MNPRPKVGCALILLGAVTLSALMGWAGRAGGLKAQSLLSQDEQTLKRAGVAIDGPGLLAYFRRRTPSGTEQAALKLRAAQLGSSRYTERARATDELIRAGRPALPFLREAARQRDAETSRRAKYCIQLIEQNTRLGLAAAAGRLLAERQPPGALETLLNYLPFVDEAWVEDELRKAVKKMAGADARGERMLEQALDDKQPKCRAVAAWILGASADPRQRAKVIPCLVDGSSEVRFLAASALVRAHEPKAVPALIGLLTGDAPELAWRAEDLLFRLAGERSPPVWLDPTNDNQDKKVRGAWETWWKNHEAKIVWNSLHLDEQPLGLTLVAESQRADGTGRLYECNKSGDIRWQVAIQNPIDVQWLPGGRLLVADSRASQVYELDTRGVIGWKHAGIAPTSVQRLPNGNTVISSYQSIIEVTRENRIVFSYKTQGHTYHARKLPDGHYVWIDASGDIGEIDDKGALVRKVKVGNGLAWGSVERLRNGRYLVALGGVGKVREIDATGNVHWECNVNNPNRAIRLDNGHTLVASHGDGCVYEFDANGTERWKHACVGRPFAVQRR
ncbi:MAG: HEAT repeat domain-containing protein [Planctomycetes bacterium]|nr:HEAT repeat domain-containing protein [Planctomycetota bacterium]